MAARRPRIKALAILPPKRNLKISSGESKCAEVKSSSKRVDTNFTPEIEIKLKNQQEQVLEINSVELSSIKNEIHEEKLTHENDNAKEFLNETTAESVNTQAENPFKFPQPSALAKKCDNSVFVDDYPELAPDESIIKRDLQIIQDASSPIKHRQRIRPTPCFGLRRNSIQGSSSDVEDEPKRQRYLSTSSNHSASLHIPSTNSRIRTESSSSYLSDYVISRDNSSVKPRKSCASEEYQKIAAAKKDFLLRFNGKTPEKSRLKMLDLIYFNPTTKPMTYSSPKDNERRPSTQSIPPPVTSDPAPKKDNPPVEKETVMPVPQLKLGPNGEMILDEQSLVIETTGEREARTTLANSNVVYLDERSGSQGFYKRHKRTKDWLPEETIKFYRCLHTLGTDFSLMLSLFPNRTRRDLKLKFKKEEKCNLTLINKALTCPKAFNIDELKIELEKEEKELAEKQKKWEEMKKKRLPIKSEQQVKIKKNGNYSRAARVLTDGEYVYENEHVSLPVRKSRLRETKAKQKQVLHEIVNKPGDNDEKVRTREKITEIEVSEKSLPPISTIIKKKMDVRDESGNYTVCDQEPISIIFNNNEILTENIVDENDQEMTVVLQVDDEIEDSISKTLEEMHTSVYVINSLEENNNLTETVGETPLSSDHEIQMAVDLFIQEEMNTGQNNNIEIISNNKESEASNTLPNHKPTTSKNEKKTKEFDKISTNGLEYNCETGHEHDLKCDNLIELLDSDKITPDQCFEIIQKNLELSEEEVKPNIASENHQTNLDKYFNDISSVLADLADGSLVLVASEDVSDPTKVINEIYIMCKETGQLSDEPLDLSEEVMNYIIEVMN